MRKMVSIVLTAGFAFFISSCNVDVSKVDVPKEVSKEIKIEQVQLDPSFVDVEKVKNELAKKVSIPEQRETSDLKDPFVLKSLKALEIASKLQQKSSPEKKSDEEEKTASQQDQETDKKTLNVAEESPMMFNFVGVSFSNNSKLAILKHLVDNKTYIVRLGDVVGGYKVIDITQNSLVLVKGSEKLVISKKTSKSNENK